MGRLPRAAPVAAKTRPAEVLREGAAGQTERGDCAAAPNEGL